MVTLKSVKNTKPRYAKSIVELLCNTYSGGDFKRIHLPEAVCICVIIGGKHIPFPFQSINIK